MTKLKTRPGHPYHVVATDEDATIVKLMGCESFNGVAFTDSQVKALLKAYDFDPGYTERVVEDLRIAHEAQEARDRAKHEEEALKYSYRTPEPFKHRKFDAEGARKLSNQGTLRNLFRHVQSDGLRVMAFISKFLEPGEDPVRFVHGLCQEAGYDVGFAFHDEEGEAEETEEE